MNQVKGNTVFAKINLFNTVKKTKKEASFIFETYMKPYIHCQIYICIFLSLFLFVQCAHHWNNKEPALTTTISLHELSCADCGEEIIAFLKKENGILKVVFDQYHAELTIDRLPELSETTIIQLLKKNGYQASIGSGKGSYLKEVSYDPSFDVKWISQNGESVNTLSHLVEGRINVIDFYAQWCEPCKEVDHAMIGILKQNKNVTLLKVNIQDWESPVAKQYLSHIETLPYIEVYGKNKQLIQAISGLDIPLLKKSIEKALKN